MNNKVLIAIIVIIALLGLGYFLSQSANRQPTVQVVPSANPEQVQVSEAVKTFDVKGTPFKFEPNEIKIKKGDRVKINFKNEQGMLHDLTIADLNVRTKQIPAGETDSMEFVADRAGTFDMICSVPTHADKGMVGKFIVEE